MKTSHMLKNLLLIAFVLCSAAFAVNNVSSVSNYTGVATFECIGVYCAFAGDDNANSQCQVAFKPAASSTWLNGLPLWRCDKDKQYRGSIVNLTAGTKYDIKLTVVDADGVPSVSAVQFQTTTWSNTFPEGTKNIVGGGSAMLNASQSGTASAYTVYQSAAGTSATINVNNAAQYCINVTGNYIIIRGLKLAGAQNSGIYLANGIHDIIIEDCDITNWGPAGNGSANNFDYWLASGILGNMGNYRVVVQNNRIHHPRGDASYWNEYTAVQGGHPKGPQAVSFVESEGGIVIRYNELYSDSAHCFNDCIGGGNNGIKGAFQKDNDIYGNILGYAWDDDLEMDCYQLNNRVWGNVFHHTFVGISTAQTGDVVKGPAYFWRNIICKSWMSGTGNPYAFKMRGRDGALYYFNNTIVTPGGPDVGYSVVTVDSMYHLTAYNSILHTKYDPIESCIKNNPTNFYDYNSYLSSYSVPSGWETHRVVGASMYDTSKGGYQYFLKAGDPAIDKGKVIPNFIDKYLGAAPDLGALETGGDTLRIGVQKSFSSGTASEAGIARVPPYGLQISPNPFVGATAVATSLPKGYNVRLEIRSLNGQTVRSIAASGRTAMWDGLDGKGFPAPAGCYIIQAQAGENKFQRKIVKLK